MRRECSAKNGLSQSTALLREALAVPDTIPCNPEVKKIDFHQHCMHGDEEGMQRLVDVNEAWGVEKAVLLSLRFPRDTRKEVRRRNDWILEMGVKYPMFVPFVTIIEDDTTAADMFKECLE